MKIKIKVVGDVTDRRTEHLQNIGQKSQFSRDLLVHTLCDIPYSPSLSCVNQSKALFISEVQHTVITTSTPLNRLSR